MAVNITGLGNANFSEASADWLEARKVKHERSAFHSQTGAVVAATEYVFALYAATATIKGFRAQITEAVATGADRTVTIDLQKSTGGGAFASILGGTIGFTNLSSLRAWSAATVSNTALAGGGPSAGDVLKITVAVAGAAGSQAQGLLVALDIAPCDPSV